MAIDRQAPEYLILSILKANPEAASVPSKSGALPLHYAAEQNLSASIITELIRAYPEALDTQDSNKQTPRDHPQRNDLSREALMRPTACWIEDTEKEEYRERVIERRAELRQKMAQLKEAIESSNERIEVASKLMTKLKPRINKVDNKIDKEEKYRTQLANMKGIMCNHLKKIKERISEIENSLSDTNTNELNMMNSMLRREYVEGVKGSYDKTITSHRQIKRDLSQMRSFFDKSTRND